MAEYRAYLLGSDGHILEAVEFVSSDDDTAQDHANQLGEGREVELWQGKRQVAKFQSHAKSCLSSGG